MPYEVNQILSGLDEPVTAAPEESLQTALDRMLRHKYSQLPVIKGDGRTRQFHFITYEMILHALHNFGSKIDGSALLVKDALVRVHNVYRPSDNLFELLAGMREVNAALIVDDNNNLINVVTSYDTTQYFRQWAEDIMHARDVEHSLKRFITYAFKKPDGEIDDDARQAAIEEITSSNRDLRKKFEVALGRYISELNKNDLKLNAEWSGQAFIELLNGSEAVGTEDNNVVSDAAIVKADVDSAVQASELLRNQFNRALLSYLRQRAASDVIIDETSFETAFLILRNAKEKAKTFNELTLDSYIQLFLNEKCWSRCKEAVNKEKEPTEYMLKGVRDTRNKLAHFREEEITTQQRHQLQRCADWLGELEKPIRTAFETPAPNTLDKPADEIKEIV